MNNLDLNTNHVYPITIVIYDFDFNSFLYVVVKIDSIS